MRRCKRFKIAGLNHAHVTLGDKSIDVRFSPLTTQLSGGPLLRIGIPGDPEYQVFCYYGDRGEAFIQQGEHRVARGCMHSRKCRSVTTWYQWSLSDLEIEMQSYRPRVMPWKYREPTTILRLNSKTANCRLGVCHQRHCWSRVGVVKTGVISDNFDHILLCMFIVSTLSLTSGD